MRLVERVEARADEVEGHGDEDAHETIHQDTSAGALLILRGHIPLYNSLVACIGDEVIGNASPQDSHPKGNSSVVEAPDEHPHLVVVNGQLPGTGETALGIAPQIQGSKDGTTYQNAALYHVTPDDGFYPTHCTIDNGNQSHQYNT